MNQSNKREQEKEERREKRRIEILGAAEILFQSKGIKPTKMTDIAKACELGKGTLYFYFKSKDEIVWKLLTKHSYEEHTAGMEYVIGLGGNGYEKLERYFKLFTDELINTYSVTTPSFQYREYIASMVVDNILTDEMKIEFKDMVDRNIFTIVKIIDEGTQDGSIINTLEVKAIGNAVGTAFGTYFRYVVGLKASFDDEYMKDVIEGLRTFTLLLLAAIKR